MTATPAEERTTVPTSPHGAAVLSFCYYTNMTTINPWINFNGNAEEAFAFYKSVFGGEFTKVVRFKDIATAEFPVAEKEADKMMHIELPVGTSTVLIGNDVPEFMGKVSENENRSKIAIRTESKEEADTIFNALSAGGNVEVPFDDNSTDTYFAMFRDRYGIEWTVEYSATK